MQSGLLLLPAFVLLSLPFSASFSLNFAPTCLQASSASGRALIAGCKRARQNLQQRIQASSVQMVALDDGASGQVSEIIWSNVRKDALNLLNSPLFLQLADGNLPPAVFSALAAERRLFLECSVRACKESAQRASASQEKFEELAIASEQLLQAHEAHLQEWEEVAEKVAAATSSPDADITCYQCGELGHSARDCPQSRVDSVLASGYRNLVTQSIQDPTLSAEQLLALCTMYSKLISFIASSLQKAELVANTYKSWFDVHAGSAFAKPHVIADEILDDAGAQAADSLLPLCTQASSLFYSYIDAMAIDAGLRGDPAKLDAMRKKLDSVEGGFLQNQDKMAAFMARLEAAQKYKKAKDT